jgi:CDGSH-type Zn-finger protein
MAKKSLPATPIQGGGEKMAQVKIRAREDGPYLVDGPAVLVDADGNESPIEGKTVALCRCGGSQNKPFCDGTHRKIDFEAPGVTVRKVKATE